MMQADTRRPSPFVAMLWKEIGQLQPIAAAVFIGFTLMQLAAVMVASVFPQYRASFEFFAYCPMFVGPLVLILGAVGILIGQERQSGTWHWNSTLPVQWKRAFAIKTSLIAVSSLALVFTLVVIPATYLYFNPDRAPKLGRELAASPAILAAALALLLGLSMLLTLWFRETLTALVTASILLLALAGLVSVAYSSSRFDTIAQRSLVLFALSAAVGAAGSCGLYFAARALFRHRWHSIQSRHSWFRRRPNLHNQQVAGRKHNSSLMVWPGYRRPQKLLSQLALDLQAPVRFQTICIALVTTCWSLALIRPTAHLVLFTPELVPLLFFAVYAASTAFAVDQQSGAWRFLSDRGASPGTVYAARLLQTSLLVLTPLFIVLAARTYVAPTDSQTFLALSVTWLYKEPTLAAVYLLPVLGAVCVITVGLYSSLCFSRPIVAFVAAAFVVLISALSIRGVYFASLVLSNPLAPERNGGWLLTHVLAWSWLAPLILLYAAWRACRRWMLRSEGSNRNMYAIWIALALSTPVVIPASTAFLLLPQVPADRISGASAYTQSMQAPAHLATGELETLLAQLREKPDSLSVVGFAEYRSAILGLTDRLTAGPTTMTRSNFADKLKELETAAEFLYLTTHHSALNGDYETAAQAIECRNRIFSQTGTALWSAAAVVPVSRNDSIDFGRSPLKSTWFHPLLKDRSSQAELEVYAEDHDLAYKGLSATDNSKLQAQRQSLMLASLRLEPFDWPPGIGFSEPMRRSLTPGLRLLTMYPPIKWRLERELYSD